jgi:competence protein ComEC
VRRVTRVLVLIAAGVASSALIGEPLGPTLDIYTVDVEGGQSTLLVSPSGYSMLIDAGYPGSRDPDRIMAAVRHAHLSRIDDLVITHFHEDHAGGTAELARRIPIDTFIDSGPPVHRDAKVARAFTLYESARHGRRHLMVAAGDVLSRDNLEIDVVSGGGVTRSTPLVGGGQPNPACATYRHRPAVSSENPRSVGVVVRFGAFRFFDPADLEWNALGALVCPTNLIGEVDAYLVAHHALDDSNIPALLAALRPRVAIANNGEHKGGGASLAALQRTAGLEGGWQLHRSLRPGAENVPEAFIANVEGGRRDVAAWLE